MNLFFKVFRAIDEPKLCALYLKGHVKVLEDYGITNITSNTNSWMENPSTYCVVALTVENEMVGGIRVQIANGIHPLPIESAIGDMDGRIYDLVRRYSLNGGIGELCGLWNSKSVAGRGVSVLLVRAGISIINQLCFKTLIGICGGYTLNMFKNVGFVIDKSLGVNGEFYYPKEDYIAWVLGILNAETLDTAADFDRERMLNLRKNPIQKVYEEGPKGKVLIDYNLVFTATKDSKVVPS